MNKPSKQNAAKKKTRAGSLAQAVENILAAPNIEAKDLEKLKTEYLALNREEKPVFFSLLLEIAEVRPDEVRPLIQEAGKTGHDLVTWRKTLIKLREKIASPRARLFRRFLGLPGGLKFLLDLRADILSAQRQGGPDLGPLDNDLVQLFESWFEDGFLVLKEITLDSPFRQIEILKNRDLVHPMVTVEEMGRRLGRDRRCFALYHHAMPEEPVVFIEAALAKGIVRSIHEIIRPKDEEEEFEESRLDTAVFYSINNTQNGLAGLGLGTMLIFQVVKHLKKTDPYLKNFCTLSPMPGFWRRYLRPMLEGKSEGFTMNVQELEKLFDKRTQGLLVEEYVSRGGDPQAGLAKVLLGVFSEAKWSENKTLVNSLAKPLSRLGYIYLAEEKNRAGQPLDPVANFHLSNGAGLYPANVNFGANWSAMGVERSLSLMVNYIYSQGWLTQIQTSMSRLGELLPELSWPKGFKNLYKGDAAAGQISGS